jgi:hypothetical protein
MMRREVQEYLRASAKLFGLAYELGALTLQERAAIVSFAQEVEKKFLPSREEGDMPLSTAISDIPLIQPHEADGPHFSAGPI